jgi:four helix bundle protein
MATVRRFEELEIWMDARRLCVEIYDISRKTNLGKDFSLKDQIIRSSGSVMDNIAEGFERDGRKEFLNFLYIAKGSLGETRSQLHRALDAGYLDEKRYNEVLNTCMNLSAKISHFIKYLRDANHDGLKKRQH